VFLNSADGTENSLEPSVNSNQLLKRNIAIYSESKKNFGWLFKYITRGI